MLNCNVKDFGALGNGKAKDTAAVQAAIDAVSQAGGGRVTLESGRFLCGRIDLKSGVELHLARDAVLLGSTDLEDFPEVESAVWDTSYAPRFNKRCFIYAEACEDIAITGRGVIDCQGHAFVVPMTEEEMAARPLMSFVRKPLPLPEGSEPISEATTMVGAYPHPLDPRSTSLAPARVVMVMACKNLLVEDVTMRNQPAGWSYWICGCDGVHVHRATITAAVDMPNNDGIHVNCSQNVTISDCNISCGDDCIVVRAYSAPLKRNTPCQKVAVTNCNLTSHTCAVRVGWINDGTIRDCTFSNLNITESRCGICAYLPGNPADARMSDQGHEHTLIENISFSNITMNRVYGQPIRLQIDEHNLCQAVRHLYFSGIHAFSVGMPVISGRDDCHIHHVYLNDCHFNAIGFDDIGTVFAKRLKALGESECHTPLFSHVDDLALTNTFFTLK